MLLTRSVNEYYVLHYNRLVSRVNVLRLTRDAVKWLDQLITAMHRASSDSSSDLRPSYSNKSVVCVIIYVMGLSKIKNKKENGKTQNGEKSFGGGKKI